MKRICVLIALGLVASFSQAQIISSASIQGSASASTTSGQDVRTRGGSPRSGFYWYWRHVTLQSTSSSVPLAFNGATGPVSSTGTYYSPNYNAAADASTTFSNGPSSALITFTGEDSTSGLPTLGAYQWSTATASLSPRFYFSVPSDTVVTITMSGSLASGSNLYALSGEIEGVGANRYVLAGGGTYCFWATWSNSGTTAGPASQSAGVQLAFRPAS